AVARRGMHEASSSIVADVIAFKQRHRKSVPGIESLERMIANNVMKNGWTDFFDLLIGRHPRSCQNLMRELVSEDQLVAWLCPVVWWRIGNSVKPVIDPR